MRKLLVFLWLTACAGTFPTPPAPPSTNPDLGLERFAEVAPGVYRSSQPNDAQWAKLVAEIGVKSEIKLNGVESLVVPPVGVKRINRFNGTDGFPLYVDIVPDVDYVRSILDAIDRAPKPVLIHCTHGEDRTGVIVALWKIRHGTSIEEAYKDMMWYGFHPYKGLWITFSRAVGWPF